MLPNASTQEGKLRLRGAGLCSEFGRVLLALVTSGEALPLLESH